MKKERLMFHTILDNRPKCDELLHLVKDKLINNINHVDSIEQSNIIFVWWWDWFMMKTISEYSHFNKIFFWANCGTLWFLLNQVANITSLPNFAHELDIVEVCQIKARIILKNWEEVIKYATNDIVIWNDLLSYFTFNVKWEWFRKTFKWTWLIISTAIWSTAYWIGMWWPLMPLKKNIWWMIWIWSRPFNFKVIDIQKEFEIKVSWRQPATAWVDWILWKVENIKKIYVTLDNKIIRLWFMKSEDFEVKRLMMAQDKLQ